MRTSRFDARRSLAAIPLRPKALAVAAAGFLLVSGAPADAQSVFLQPKCTPSSGIFNLNIPLPFGQTIPIGGHFRRCGVPDFDQQRLNALGNNGINHCVPASTMNWFAYIADRGFPTVMPGTGHSEFTTSPARYNQISAAINQLGQFMRTNPAAGTSAPDAIVGMNAWLTLSSVIGPTGISLGNIFFTSSDHGARVVNDVLVAPTPAELALAGATGALVMPAVRWWRFDFEIVLGGLFVRNYTDMGGHQVALPRAHPTVDQPRGFSDPYMLYFNDPGTGPVDAIQSTFLSQPVGAGPQETVVVTRTDSSGERSSDVWRASKLAGYGNGWLTSYKTITPKLLLAPDPSFRAFFDYKALGLQQPRALKFAALPEVIDFQRSPRGFEQVFLRSNGNVLITDALSGEYRSLASVPGARRLVFDEFERLLVLDDQGIVIVTPGAGEPARALTDQAFDHLVYSPAHHKGFGLRQDTSSLVVIGPDLRETGEIITLPSVPPPGTPVSLSVNARDALIGLMAEGSATVTLVRMPVGPSAVGTTISELKLDSGGQGLTGLQADDSGLWYAVGVEDHRVHAFFPDGSRYADHPFKDVLAGPQIRLSQSAKVGIVRESIELLPSDAPPPAQEVIAEAPASAQVIGTEAVVKLRLVDHAGGSVALRNLCFQRSGAHPGEGRVRSSKFGDAQISWPGTQAGEDLLVIWDDAERLCERGPDEAQAYALVSWVAPPLPAVSLSRSKLTLQEGARVRVTVRLSAPSEETVSAVLSVGGTAEKNNDYTIQPASRVSFEPGQTAKTITLTALDDADAEPAETIKLNLKNPRGAVLGTPKALTVTLPAND